MGDPIITETFVEYAIGMVFLLVRMYARLKFGGLKGLRIDDAFAGAAMAFWTAQSVIIYFLETMGSNIGLTTESAMLIPDSQVPQLVTGSKLAFTNWIWYMCYIWCLKSVLLFLYWKLTDGTNSQRLVMAAIAFCAMSWLGCMLTHICICAPITRNWQIKPYAGDNCTLRKPLYIVICLLNVLSDIVVMVTPVLVIRKLQVPLQRKIILGVMFMSGIFIIICSILRCYYSLGDLSTLSTALQWADRECFVAAIVASLPGIKPLFRGVRWLGMSDYSNSHSKTPYSSQGYNKFASKNDERGPAYSFPERNRMELGTIQPSTRKDASSEESERPILDGKNHVITSVGPGSQGPPPRPDPFSIHVTTEYSLEAEHKNNGHR